MAAGSEKSPSCQAFYGNTRDDAVAEAKALAFRVLAGRLEHGEANRTGLTPSDL